MDGWEDGWEDREWDGRTDEQIAARERMSERQVDR